MWSSAIKQYAAILEAKPDTLDAYRGIAEAYSWRTEYGTALDYLRRAFTYASTDSAKIDIYSQMVAINQSQVGQGKPLSAPGLDASFELAKLYLAQGKTAQAKEKLEKIAMDAPTYRKDEVASLLVQAGGGTPATPTTGSPQTPSNGR
jgi:tetratricopeptide (TPR) repeat protein